MRVISKSCIEFSIPIFVLVSHKSLQTTGFLLNEDGTKSGLFRDYAFIPDPIILDPDVTFFQAPYLAHVRPKFIFRVADPRYCLKCLLIG